MTTTPKLTKVIRLDNLPLDQTYYTEEGYLKDKPIVTRTGIFEYTNADGTVSRELRLPEDVFAPESLESYKGKPVIITHDAGLVNKDNVSHEQIGTILSEGCPDGDKVRAEIIIHDTDELKSCGLRELSLGYNLDLEYTEGVWNGQHYDAIQRNIRINHLALVQEARAGETARLNIDGRDKKNFKEDSSMKKNIKKTGKRSDGVLSPEQLAQAIEEYKARRANRLAAKADEEAAAEEVVSVKPATDNEETAPAAAEPVATIDEDTPVEEKVEIVKDRRDRRDAEGDPATVEEAQGVIAKQDEDMDILFDIIDTLLAEKAFDEAEEIPAEEKTDEGEEVAEGEENLDEGEEIPVAEGEEIAEDEGEETPVDPEKVDNETAPTVEPKDGATMNADSVDAIVRQRVQLGMVGRMLNMDGLETMKLMAAKKTVIKAVRPGLRLDGKSKAYINAAFDCAVADVMARSKKDTKYQKKQMFNGDSRTVAAKGDSASAARERMIKRQFEKEDK